MHVGLVKEALEVANEMDKAGYHDTADEITAGVMDWIGNVAEGAVDRILNVKQTLGGIISWAFNNIPGVKSMFLRWIAPHVAAAIAGAISKNAEVIVTIEAFLNSDKGQKVLERILDIILNDLTSEHPNMIRVYKEHPGGMISSLKAVLDAYVEDAKGLFKNIESVITEEDKEEIRQFIQNQMDNKSKAGSEQDTMDDPTQGFTDEEWANAQPLFASRKKAFAQGLSGIMDDTPFDPSKLDPVTPAVGKGAAWVIEKAMSNPLGRKIIIDWVGKQATTVVISIIGGGPAVGMAVRAFLSTPAGEKVLEAIVDAVIESLKDEKILRKILTGQMQNNPIETVKLGLEMMKKNGMFNDIVSNIITNEHKEEILEIAKSKTPQEELR